MTARARKFLIIKMSSIGDVMHALPALHTLRMNHPGARIAWVIEERFRDLLYNNPDVDEVIVTRTRHWRKHWTLKSLEEILGVIRKIRGGRFDTVFDFHGLLKSGLIALLSGAPRRIGLHKNNCKEKINVLFTNRKGPYIGKGVHVADICRSLVLMEGDGPPQETPPPLAVPSGEQGRVESFFQARPELTARPIIGINPGAGFESKRWSLSRFARLADRIADELGFSILLTWGPGEEEKVKSIADQMKQRSWLAPPTSLLESIALYRRLALMVSCDSGPLHLAAAVETPTVSIFGPTDPARNGAYGPNHAAVFKVLTCSFCWKKKCPLHTNECMKQVSVDDVFEAVRKSASRYIKTAAP